MCGRFAYVGPIGSVRKLIRIDDWDWLPDSNFNIAPTQMVPAVIKESDRVILRHLHWGLVPFWAKDPKIGSRMINARFETLTQKPSFKNAFKKRRCLILSNGYYEWSGPKGYKQPYFITTQNRELFCFAGLWETWHNKEDKSIIQSCAIITTEATVEIAHIHNRMPAMLAPEHYERWLDPDLSDVDELMGILDMKGIDRLQFFPVSKDVNSVKNNGPELLRAIHME